MDFDSVYWMIDTLRAVPAVIWVYIGLGLPWALVILPRRDWRDRAQVSGVAFALGPGILTAWMLIVGTLGAAQNQPLLRLDIILTGTFIAAISGMILVWRKKRRTQPEPIQQNPLAADEKLLLILIAAALILRWLTTSFWPFTAYDSLWVYGYEGRLYFLEGFIPQKIGYYPQFLPLQYTYTQLAFGAINDHAARAVLPFLHLGSILAAYTLGLRLFSRRAGIFTAAIWALYPHVGDWAHIGDLEIPLTFLFTLAAAFFLAAWTEKTDTSRRRYALLAGILLGIALWTKPTAGGLIWGMMLLTGIDLLRSRLNWRAWRPRFETVVITGTACVPLGGIWYLRNALLGHEIINLPPDLWLTLARRSGDLFGWPLLALAAISIMLLIQNPRARSRKTLPGLLLALLLMLAGVLSSLPSLNPERYNPPASYIQPLEWGLLLAGGIIWIMMFVRLRQKAYSDPFFEHLSWATLLALPYFITYFYSYSYHYRLVFAIVPLMILPIGASTARRLTRERQIGWSGLRYRLYLLLIAALAFPGVVTTLFDTAGNIGWLWSDELPDDMARYQVQNPELVAMVYPLQDHLAENGSDPVVIAPGDQRLQFFFPQLQIDNNALPNQPGSIPTRLDDLQGATHFIYGAHARWLYADHGILPQENQIISALARTDIMTQVAIHAEGTFRYELYELALENRFLPPEEGPILYLLEDEVIFGGKIQFVGSDVAMNNLTFRPGERAFFDFSWRVIDPLTENYDLALALLNEDDGQVYAVWKGPIAPGLHGAYLTSLWQPGEIIIDRRILTLDHPEDIPSGENYRVIVRFIDSSSGKALPVTRNNVLLGDGIEMAPRFRVRIPRS